MNTKRKQMYKQLNLSRWVSLGKKKGSMLSKQLHSETMSMESIQAVVEGWLAAAPFFLWFLAQMVPAGTFWNHAQTRIEELCVLGTCTAEQYRHVCIFGYRANKKKRYSISWNLQAVGKKSCQVCSLHEKEWMKGFLETNIELASLGLMMDS